MAIRYEIATWSTPISMKAMEYRSYSRGGECVANEIYRQIYQMLAGDGALDTERGHRLVDEFYSAERREQFSAPPIGCYRKQDFVLRPNDPMSPRVTFWAQRG